jgi:hypothetical protein
MIAASILKSRGFEQFEDVVGGMAEIAKSSIPRTDYVCLSQYYNLNEN